MGKGAGKGGHTAAKKEERGGVAPVLQALVASFTTPKVERPSKARQGDAAPRNKEGRYTLAQVQTHNTPEDSWVIVRGKVYDVTEFAPMHPGGAVINTYAGKDATDVFTTFHAGSSWAELERLHIGTCVDPDETAMLKDFREMRAAMVKAGLFKPSKGYYVFKVVSLLGTLAASYALAGCFQSWLSVAAAGALLGLFWQQAGWLAHDFCHNQVFQDRSLNHAFGLFLGNVLQGFSVSWWKHKHNTHHAAPNEITGDGHSVDPDIDTLPMFAWSVDQLPTLPASMRGLVRYQEYVFLPMLIFARLSWCQSSYNHVVGFEGMTTTERRVELALLAAHHAGFLAAPYLLLPAAKATALFLLGQFVAGFFLGFVFVQSHNAMEVYSEEKDFVSAQVHSTRNIHSTVWNDFFTGGLNRQIEHHLFPTLPRHNLGKAAELVKSHCAKHGMVYEDISLADGTSKVMERLREVAAAA
mmetsp:Transcript_10044/g.35003  ORF Transcript_10044/g.35003 Transcript_10044/m.35003 type:complete len:469 (+) Transcript_10044:180-1586(+)|eukprot:CAMPEP_0183789334 /NCGR_PEP_ID=MMETSP0803_2-20130417/357_1 /TAXON_ID=195967 /ORGANISM="Crustomastix stigmata, Strain CCMP3273" /LENGTH=468 /DNA_ID=CAMNT_0026033499 /DNA_START=164 /DNA_END=1570 /DNA_ORIENTATION=+